MKLKRRVLPQDDYRAPSIDNPGGTFYFRGNYRLMSLGVRFSNLAFTTTMLAGGAAGLGFFAFDYGEGLSYFSTEPKACANCHVMWDQYDSWQKGGHHQAAGCVDCHLPHDLIPKYLAKADNGFWHSKGFTFMDFNEPIQIKPRNSAILQNACLRCHGDFVHDLVPGSRSVEEATLQCVHCHRHVGHGARH